MGWITGRRIKVGWTFLLFGFSSLLSYVPWKWNDGGGVKFVCSGRGIFVADTHLYLLTIFTEARISLAGDGDVGVCVCIYIHPLGPNKKKTESVS